MKRYLLIGTSVLFLLTVITACSPKPAPTRVPAPQPNPSATTSTTSNLSLPASQDAAWAQVEEAAKKEGRLVIYGGGTFATAGREIARNFAARYGITLDILVLGGSQTVERLKVERAMGQPVVDVISAGVSSSTEIVLSGLADGVAESLPVLRDRSVFYVDPVYGPQQQIIASEIALVVPIINTNQVGPDEVKSWNDLLNPKWKGRLIMLDPRTTGSALNLFSTLTYFKVLDYDYFRQITRQAPNLWGGASREAGLMVGRGEYAISLANDKAQMDALIVEGAPLKAVAMEEGIISQPLGVIVAKGAPHPNAARLFTNWFLTPEGQESYAKTMGSRPLRKDMPDFTSERTKINPKKVWNRTWEAAEQSNKDLKSGIVEQIFGKK